MKVHDCIQGSAEWLSLRAGIPTASQFDLIVTPKGQPSKSAERYLYTLLAERLMGRPITEHVSFWMQRGSQMEAEAIAFYEFQRDVKTVPVGLLTNDDETAGASPDRLVDEEGLLEIKVPKEYIHMGYLLESGSHYEAYKVQCQGQLWISGRKWTDVLSYHPELPPALVRIERDEKFIQILSNAVETFSLELERMHELTIERGWATSDQPKRSAQDDLVRAMKESLVEVSKR
jgi:hypothetical protein